MLRHFPSIDPMLSVDYASVNGRTATFSAQQDKYGMHIVPAPGALSSIPSDGERLHESNLIAGKGCWRSTIEGYATGQSLQHSQDLPEEPACHMQC